MDSSNGVSSGLTSFRNSGSEEDHDLKHVTDQRKRKRMLSNRESARRSRMRKQKHLDELSSKADRIRKENSQTITNMNITAQLYGQLEMENSILRAQMAELSHRLQSLNDIISCLKSGMSSSTGTVGFESDHHDHDDEVEGFVNSWSSSFVNQLIMVDGHDHHHDMFMC